MLSCFNMTSDDDGEFELLDADDIGREMGVHVVTVRKWWSTGQLAARKIGRRQVSRRSDLREFIERRFAEPTS